MVQATTADAETAGDHLRGEDAAAKPKKKIPKIEVNAVLFRAANEFTSNEDTRYYLQGVYVQPHPEKGALLTATDGHRLICIHDETGECSEAAIVIVESNLAGIKIDKKKPDAIPRLRLDADGHVIVGTYRSLESAIIDATYPDYARVLLPVVKALQKGVFAPASFRHDYLLGFSRVADTIGSDKKAIRLISTAESEPALILFEGAPHAFGILMPMRANCQNGMPAWMRPILEPLQAPPSPPPSAAAAPSPRVRARKHAKIAAKRKPAKAKKKSRAKK